MDDESLRVCERAAAHRAGCSRPGVRRRRRAGRRSTPAAATRHDVERVRSHFDFPGTGRVVTNNAATSQTPRELIDLYRTPVAVVRERPPGPVGRVAADHRHPSRSPSTPSRPGSTHPAGGASRPTRTPPRRSTRSCTRCSPSSATATTWSPPLMEHNSNYVPWHALSPRGPAPARPSGGVPGRPLRPPTPASSTSTTSPSSSTTAPSWSRVTGASNFLGTKPPAGPGPSRSPTPAATTQARRAAAGRCSWSTPRSSPPPTPSTCSRAGRRLPRLLLPQGARPLRRRRPLRPRAPAGAVPAVPLRRRHDRRGQGHAWATWSTTSCPGSSPPAPPTSWASSPPPRRSDSWSTWRSTTAHSHGSSNRQRRSPAPTSSRR